MERFAKSMVLAAAVALAGCGMFTFPFPPTPATPQPKIDTEAAIAHYVRSQGMTDAAALAELDKALQADPTLSVAHAATGDIHRRQGNIEMARQAYEAACSANPYYFKPHYNLGVLYQQLAEAAETDSLFQKYLLRACELYLRANAIKTNDYDTNLNLAACYFQLGKYHQAEEYCQAAIAIDDDRPQAWSNLAIIYDNQNKLTEAIAAYRQALERDVHQPRLHMNLAASYLRQGWVKDAVASFKAAAVMDKTLVEPHLQLGACYYRLKDLNNAQASYEHAASLAPKNAEAFRGIGIVCMAKYIADKDNPDLREQALDAWKRSLQLKPNQPDLVKLLEKYKPKYDETGL
ncbi:MAG: tetratricopeptide repeat protein [Phycisphaerae bacterium]|nr:tetratricopeptide repeat protein [Phycisphaerae bacterium]